MDQQRGRSPSAGHQHHINQNHSPSPHQYQENVPNSIGIGLGVDSAQAQNLNNSNQYSNPGFNSNQGLPSYGDNSFLNQQSPYSQNGLGNASYGQDFGQQFKQEDPGSLSPFSQQQQPTSFTQDLLSADISTSFSGADFPLYSAPSTQDQQLDQSYFMNDFSPRSGHQSINPAELDMSSPPTTTATPPGMLHMDRSPSNHQSPSFNQNQFQPSPGHSRQVSLGPESAAFPQGQQGIEWGMMPPQFQGHRRTPSEYSDVSTHSAAHSPNLGHHDSFDGIDQHHSPMQNPQDASLYQQVLSIGDFSLSDPQIQHGSSPGRGLSPAHSPAISPRLVPQQLSGFGPQSHFMLNNNGFAPSNVYGNQSHEQFPQIQQGQGSLDMGQAQQMAPPEINVEFAPASRQNSFEPPKPSLDQDALTPPERGRRRRAASDPYNSASTLSHPRPSSMSPNPGSDISDRLTPDSARSVSPNDRSGASSPAGRRRQSTSALPNRDYILGLADPDYQAAAADSSNTKRVQKHPATFQCTLCPKRFTRAYNLRSHLRTHTDERPFVCTVCGKAFARQHDRKRHEGLHSGEKKFVCRGELKQGGQWGCGRRFARADALGRHFRSEAGRICIKPLLDEEAIERQRVWQEQRLQNMSHNMQQQPVAMDANGFPMDASGNYTLPAALLAQYPALANLSWSELSQGEVGMDDDPSGRSSFDASGSEFYEEDEGGYVSAGPGPGPSFGQGQMNKAYSGYSSDIGR
ncbi:hypothetical protein PVAG01_04007 [Phlyctema vagabunda]|uniref:C2H2-type domain-containing protein n=1 Tax=Phlyctema vagabunda TaxID=108571 RepID=A0ABR4PN25_9HELO